MSSLLAYANRKGGICESGYSPALAQKLHDPKVFALINMNIQRRFTSGHALALYENCYRFVRTGSTGWWPIEPFWRLMGVGDSAYYEVFKQLNAKIIKPAVEEVNRSSNIIVTPETRKMGRAVTDIRFLIRENPQLAILDLDDGEGVRRSPVYERCKGLGASDRLARQWIAEHGEALLVAKLDYVEGQGEVRNPVGYLTAALRKDPAGPGETHPGGDARDPGKGRTAAADPGGGGPAHADAARRGPAAVPVAAGGRGTRRLRALRLDEPLERRGDPGVLGRTSTPGCSMPRRTRARPPDGRVRKWGLPCGLSCRHCAGQAWELANGAWA